MSKTVHSELSSEYLGVVGLNNFAGMVSGARLAMFCQHIGQALVVDDPSVKRLFTGMEREYGKNIHDIRFPCRARIIKIVRKYPNTMGFDRVQDKNNPISTIIYEDVMSPDRRIGILNLERYHCVHQYFGFNYKYDDDVLSMIRPGAFIEKDTVLATSPSITSNGDYRFGLEAQVALMSDPSVTEDGVWVSESFLKRMTTRGYGVRQVSWGRNAIPVNLYGDETQYKAFPDIGERVGQNGLLFASRSCDPQLAIPLMSRDALRKIDFADKPVYAMPNAKIVDVIVHRGNKDKNNLPDGMHEQLQYYYGKSLTYYHEILKEYNRLKRENGDWISLSPEFNQLVTDAIAMTTMAERRQISPTYNRQTLDDWMVTIVFEYDVVPTIGFKITGMHGNKGVICKISKDEDMPVDAMGNRAEIVMDALSIVKRMNPSVTTELYINASGWATQQRLKQIIAPQTPAAFEAGRQYVQGFYEIVSPPMDGAVKKHVTNWPEHLNDFAKHGHYIYLPTDNPVHYPDVIDELSQKYPACYGPVQYRGGSGRLVTTKFPVLIGGGYILLLEKTGNTWSGVSSAKLQHFGIPAKLTNSDKYSSPGRHNPTRILGESEVRLIAAMCGGDVVAELLDQTNNPVAHEAIVSRILHENQPTNIKNIIDRRAIPRGNGRILTLIRHVLECGGVRFTKGASHAVNVRA